MKDFHRRLVPALNVELIESVEQVYFVKENGELFIERLVELGGNFLESLALEH